MSSITPADRSRQTDELRNQREEHESREAEQTKKQKREMRRMAEKQDQEIQQLKDNYENQIKELKKNSNEQMTKRDLQNQAKIEQLRNMYTQTLRKKVETGEAEKDAEVDSLKGQLGKERQIHEQQRHVLKQNFDDSLAEKDRMFQSHASRSREEMKSTIGDRAEKLAEKHQKEMKAVLSAADERKQMDQRTLKETASYLEGKMKDQKLQSDLKFERAQANWNSNREIKESENETVIRARDEALKFERQKLQDRFNDITDKKTVELNELREDLKGTILNRVNRDIRAAEAENRQIKNDHLVQMVSSKRIRDLEKERVILDYEDRMKKLGESKDGLIEKGKEVNQERIAEVLKKNEGVMQEATRRFKTDQMIEKGRHAEDRNRLEIEHTTQLRKMGTRTDQRLNMVMKNTSEAQKAQIRQHTEIQNSMKNSYQEELAKQREAQMDQLKDTFLRMDERVRTTEDKWTKKMEDTVNNYELKIAQLQEQHRKELSRQSEVFDQRLRAERKAQEVEIKGQENKTDIKVTQIQEQHEKEVERMQKRHQEQMQSLAQKLSYYRKNS